jgi:ATP-dependent DNA helicase RecQ
MQQAGTGHKRAMEVDEALAAHWPDFAGGLRDAQRRAVNAIVSGRDAFVVMATGSGKSVCMQLPAIVRGKTAIIISPLISLMEDQVGALVRRGVRACMLGSAQKDKQVARDAWDGKYQIVYLSPELAVSNRGIAGVQHLDAAVGGISLVAIDEAHCISEWGRDFRQEYLQLGKLRATLPNAPIIAVTATATPRVRREIVQKLYMHEPVAVVSSFERPNLRFEVAERTADAKDAAIAVAGIARAAGPTIVYVITTRQADALAGALRDEGVQALAYHAKMDTGDRSEVHRAFLADEPSAQVVVATLAYGMGIDKPNVRAVVHCGAPASLEAYYQQAGRAGRDGGRARCVLLWANQDFSTLRFMQRGAGDAKAWLQRGLREVEGYIHTQSCRAAHLVNHFEGDIASRERMSGRGPCAGTCDICCSST